MAHPTDDRLRLLIERVERLEEEKKGYADDIRDVYAEAKAVGYDVRIMRQIVRLRKLNADDRCEMETLLDTYKAALGMAGPGPLFAETHREDAPDEEPLRLPPLAGAAAPSPETRIH